MQNIRFRGQKLNYNDWVYGTMIFTHNCHYILPDEYADLDDVDVGRAFVQVKSETVSMKMGVDKEGQDLFEYDIILDENGKFECIQYHRFSYYPFEFNGYDTDQNLPENCKKIGNRFDDPETYKGLYNLEYQEEQRRLMEEKRNDPDYQEDLPF